MVSIHAAHEGGDAISAAVHAAPCVVSIHAAHEGGDDCAGARRRARRCFNPRRPRGRRRATIDVTRRAIAVFQSTPPTRAATTHGPSLAQLEASFNPRRPRGRRPRWRCVVHAVRRFNPRRPRGRRRAVHAYKFGRAVFQSTPPTRAATQPDADKDASNGVSIHAAHEGGDALVLAQGMFLSRFNPRRPRGRRRAGRQVRQRIAAFQSTPPTRAATATYRERLSLDLFQSTPPTRAATQRSGHHAGADAVSIHAAHEGGDKSCTARPYLLAVFQSTPPTRAATYCAELTVRQVSIHAAHEGGDQRLLHKLSACSVSIHAAHEGGDLRSFRL